MMLSPPTMPLADRYQFFKTLQKLPFVKRIFLFGSRARGDQEERSDIDLAIDCPTANDQEWLKVLDIVDNADTLLHIDCIRYDQLNQKPLKQRIDQEGVLLYAKP